MTQPLAKRVLLGAVAMAGFALLFTGCGGQQEQGPSKESLAALSQQAQQVNIRLPAFVANAPSPIVRETYALAYANRDVLQYMPCYCGCVDSGHTSNQNCFIDSVNLNGEVVWDKMGTD